MAEDYSNLQVNVLNEDGTIASSHSHPRLTMTVLALMAGMSIEEVQQLLSLPDDEIQELMNRIGQEFVFKEKAD